MRLAFTVGALLRRPVRQACLMLDLEYKEEKGWLSSTFVVFGHADRISRLEAWLQQYDSEEEV